MPGKAGGVVLIRVVHVSDDDAAGEALVHVLFAPVDAEVAVENKER